jgi:hypothetical protein
MMKKRFLGLCILTVAFCLFLTPAFSAEETNAVYSPKCDVKKFKDFCGEACKKVEKGSWEGGVNVTLDTDKLSWADLTKKLTENKCI